MVILKPRLEGRKKKDIWRMGWRPKSKGADPLLLLNKQQRYCSLTISFFNFIFIFKTVCGCERESKTAQKHHNWGEDLNTKSNGFSPPYLLNFNDSTPISPLPTKMIKTNTLHDLKRGEWQNMPRKEKKNSQKFFLVIT